MEKYERFERIVNQSSPSDSKKRRDLKLKKKNSVSTPSRKEGQTFISMRASKVNYKGKNGRVVKASNAKYERGNAYQLMSELIDKNNDKKEKNGKSPIRDRKMRANSPKMLNKMDKASSLPSTDPSRNVHLRGKRPRRRRKTDADDE